MMHFKKKKQVAGYCYRSIRDNKNVHTVNTTAFSCIFENPILLHLDRFCRKAVCTAALSTSLALLSFTDSHSSYSIAAHAAQVSQSSSTTAATVEVTTSNEHKAAVEEAWKIIHDFYLDETYNGVDWDAERNAFQPIEFNDTKQAYKSIRKMISKLGDRYTRALDPDQMKSLGKFDVSGVGLLLTTNASGKLIVAIDPPIGTSAAEAGIKRGDEVVSVEGRSIDDGTAFDVAQWMQGADGSQMYVKFRNAGEKTLVRHFKGSTWTDKNSNSPAVSRVALVDTSEGPMGYIHLGEFQASARSEVAAALADLKKQGAEWILLDLRGNGGGVFEGAVEIAGLFEGDGKPVALVNGRGSEREKFVSHFISGETEVETEMDLGILIDRNSASSSEVLAGGLHDNCRAALVGHRSYGKGLIQGVFGLSDGGGIVVTVAEYQTPNGDQINGTGIQPDVVLNDPFREFLRRIGIEYVGEKGISVTREQIRESVSACRALDAT